MSHLPDPVKEVLDSSSTNARLDRIWRGVSASNEEPKSKARIYSYAMAAMIFLVATGSLAFGLWKANPLLSNLASESSPYLLLQDGALPGRLRVAAGANDEVLRFQEGSSIRLHQGADLVAAQNRSQEIVFDLDRGEANFEVAENSNRLWTVRTAAGSLETRGARFVVLSDSQRLDVQIMSGTVTLHTRSNDDVSESLVLGAGQHHRTALVASPAVEPPNVEASPNVASLATATHAQTAVTATASAAAGSVAANSAPPSAAPRQESPSELLARAEDALHGHDEATAERLLLLLMREASTDESRYARIYLAELRAARNQASAVVNYLPLRQIRSWPAPLAERAFDLVFRSAAGNERCAYIRDYQERFPNGLHHRFVLAERDACQR